MTRVPAPKDCSPATLVEVADETVFVTHAATIRACAEAWTAEREAWAAQIAALSESKQEGQCWHCDQIVPLSELVQVCGRLFHPDCSTLYLEDQQQ